ncbi:FAD-dependent oxidoreductase [Acidocella sp.]|uniref:FAD-dependent oxidoreductase n=1 Tax=Acidocella sp. TaxID=50710 RepID=UPI002610FEA8|nr:FAD-dependent oxidoreductase [Acidocella sp.]
MPERDVDYLILGSGGAAAAAAAMLRLEREDGTVMMLSAAHSPPYYRPALSKQYLLGGVTDAQIQVYPSDFFERKRIDLVLNTRAVMVDAAASTVLTETGETLRYQRLLIATGTEPVRLDIEKAGLPGIHYLRHKEQCQAIRQDIAAGARRAVILGGSFLGMEIGMSLAALGVAVTIVEREDRLLPHVEADYVSAFFKRHAEEKGARILLEDTVAAIHGEARISAVTTRAGEHIECDMMVVSMGMAPSTEYLKGSGIALEDGFVLVDDRLRTNVPNIFAAGDVVNYDDPVFMRRRHIEHWDHAVKQGKLAARNMLGHRLRFDEVSYFFCDIGDVSFSMLGAPEEADERIARGSLESGSLALFYLKNNVPRALLSVNRPVKETRSVEGFIRHRVNLAAVKDRLADPEFSLDHIPTQTALVLQGGGAMGAFECGIVRAMEEEGIYPDIVAGVSIGALNGAIIAGNPRHATQALASFWSELAVETPRMLGENMARAITSVEILTFGVPRFFRPRWLPQCFQLPPPPSEWLSFYDPSPMRELIARYVDFPRLRASPVRLLVGAVKVTTGKLEIFDSYVDDMTPDHVLASGSLPPGFPWTKVEGEAYWDGGLVSNSPLDMVTERCGLEGKRVFIVDLYAGERPLPNNLAEVMARRDEIVFAERVRRDLRWRELTASYRQLVDSVLEAVEPTLRAKLRQRPIYIELMGDGSATHITRFIRQGQQGEPASRDYDFSDIAINANKEQGYRLAKATLAGEGPGAQGRTGMEAEADTSRHASMMPEGADVDLQLASASYRHQGRGKPAGAA